MPPACIPGPSIHSPSLSTRYSSPPPPVCDAELLKASRNLSFFTSFYRYLIAILPAAVVAPLYFRGEIEFGVINQSSSGGARCGVVTATGWEGARLRRGRRGGVLSAGGIVDTSTCLPLQPSATSLATSRWWSSSLRRLLASRVSFLSPLPRPEGVWCGRVPAGGAEVGEQGPLRWTSLTPLGSSS